METLQTYLAIPTIAERPESVRVLIRNVMMKDPSLTVDEIEQILPSDKQLKQEQAEVLAEVKKVQDASQNQQKMGQEQEQIVDQQDAQAVEGIQDLGG